jgi:hypothetical protein
MYSTSLEKKVRSLSNKKFSQSALFLLFVANRPHFSRVKLHQQRRIQIRKRITSQMKEKGGAITTGPIYYSIKKMIAVRNPRLEEKNTRMI